MFTCIFFSCKINFLIKNRPKLQKRHSVLMYCLSNFSSNFRIPVLDTTTQVLDLSYNNFAKIRESVFRERNLYNLQKIFLHHCGISMVVGRCFEGITNLVEVDLSRNLLNNVPKEALRDCGYLMVLNLRGNPIRQVPGDSFLKLQELQTLDLAECQITSIQPEALSPLHNLIWLKLENNLLVHLDPLSGFPNSEAISYHNLGLKREKHTMVLTIHNLQFVIRRSGKLSSFAFRPSRGLPSKQQMAL